jgi:small subunit ribosomal protein S14
MRKHLKKDKSRRIAFAKAEKLRLVLKALYINQFLPLRVRNMAHYILFQDKNYFVRIRNFCIITGRGRGILHSFKISRHCFKKYASNGFIEGISKSSW